MRWRCASGNNPMTNGVLDSAATGCASAALLIYYPLEDRCET
jgi:hypothetical protein